MRRILPWLCLFFLFFSHCQSQKEENDVSRQIFRLNIAEDPVSFDPRFVRKLKDLTLMKQLYEGLMRLDENGVPQPALAKEYVLSEDGCTYTFILRTAYWSNGEKITSNDFARAWKETLTPTFPSDYAHILYPIKNAYLARIGKRNIEEIGVHTPDEETLIVQLEAPAPYFLELTAFPTYFPTYASNNKEKPISNGPFVLKDFKPQSCVVLEKNHRYWDSQSVHLDQLHFLIIPDNLTEHYLYEKKELDWLGQPISNAISVALHDTLKRENLLSSYAVDGTSWLQFNVSASPFHIKKIRQAFSYAIHRQEIIDYLLQGDQKLATGLLPPSLALDKAHFKDHDIAKAKQLFEEALLENGWDIETFPTVTITYQNDERMSKLVQLVQQQWEEVFNIPIYLEIVERSGYKALLKSGHYQIGSNDWIADYHDPLAFLEIFQYCFEDNSGINSTRWSNSVYADLIQRAKLTNSRKERDALFAQAERILMEEMPIAPLYHLAFEYLKKEEWDHVILSPLGLADFKHVTLRN